MNEILIAPSILSCDFSKLGEEIAQVEKAGADWIHVDVMDGHFVDNLTIGPPVVSSIKKTTRVPLDVHLMIEKPENTIDRYIKAGANFLTIHVEATKDAAGCLKKIRELGCKAGITLKPKTPVKEIESLLKFSDLVLVMTVNPGWGGQAFMPEQLEKVKFLKSWATKNKSDLLIEVDGGVNSSTASECRNAGAKVLVAGHAIFKSPDYSKAINELRGKS